MEASVLTLPTGREWIPASRETGAGAFRKGAEGERPEVAGREDGWLRWPLVVEGGAPHLDLLPWGDLCVTLGRRLWQGRADPTSPRPHPNPLPAGEGEDLPAPPTPQPAGGLGKGSPAEGGFEDPAPALLQFRPEREGRRGGRFANRPYGRCRRVPRGWRTSIACGGCEGAPHLNLLPWGDLCVTLGGRFWQGRADPTSPRPHPNPLPSGRKRGRPPGPTHTSAPRAGLGKGSPAERGKTCAPCPLAVSSRGGKAGGESDSQNRLYGRGVD